MTLSSIFGSVIAGLVCSLCAAGEPIDVGSRLELFVDDDLIERMTDARLVLHHPVTREVAIDHNEPWEGNICCGHVVFQDGDLYRMYYRGRHYDEQADRTSIRTANRTSATRR